MDGAFNAVLIQKIFSIYCILLLGKGACDYFIQGSGFSRKSEGLSDAGGNSFGEIIDKGTVSQEIEVSCRIDKQIFQENCWHGGFP